MNDNEATAVLVGDVLRLRDGRWRVVQVAATFAVTDRRRSPAPARPAFGPGSFPPARLAEESRPDHVKVYRLGAPGQPGSAPR